MRIIARRTLQEYWEGHADAEAALNSWYKEVRLAKWTSLQDIKIQYPSASILGHSRVCFNIKGNNYRLIAAVFIATGVVMVKFVGTHAEYMKVDALAIEPE